MTCLQELKIGEEPTPTLDKDGISSYINAPRARGGGNVVYVRNSFGRWSR